jgi:hypothetical protein
MGLWLPIQRAIAAITLVMASVSCFAAADPIAEGKRIYHEGMRASGEPVEAAVRSDVTMQGAGLACVHCHRRSGFGSSESRVVIPPINGNILFTTQHVGFQRDYRDGRLGNVERPAYTLQTLARALREGIDTSGRPLVPMMPRYHFSDDEVVAIAAYLNTLSSDRSPGITDEDIHFATVITPGTGNARRKAMQSVVDAYVADKNSGTRSELRRAERAPFQKEWMYSAYRKWKMHTWELSGPESGWGTQLAEYYHKQPVFALLGGIGDERWQAVHDYCEKEQIPCLFPHISTPPQQQQNDFYSIYFSSGLRLEAGTLVADLDSTWTNPILQLRRHGMAKDASRELSRLISTRHGASVDEVVIDTPAKIKPQFIDLLLELKRPDVLVLWLETADMAALDAIAASHNKPRVIYLSSTLMPDSVPLTSHALAERIRLLHPYLLPDQEHKIQRFQFWARRARVELIDPRLQADTYFALNLAGEALMHIRNNQTREYFIERIEHMTDSMIETSYYPRLALAPGQRYAAKGAYVWQLNKPPSSARWIVP